jgi:hypothetical protein
VGELQPRVDVQVAGGDGADTFMTNVGSPDDPGTATDRKALVTEFDIDYDGGAGADTFLTSVSNVEMFSPWVYTARGGAGADVFTNTYTGLTVNAPLSVNLSGDGGADTIALSFNGQAVNAGGSVDVNLSGGDGNDSLTTVLTNITNGGFDPYRVIVDGGSGNDNGAIVIYGFTGDLTTSVDLGAGDDTAAVRVQYGTGLYFDGVVNAGAGRDIVDVEADLSGFDPSSDHTNVTVDGGDGSDHLTFLVHPPERPTTNLQNLQLLLDGGSGDDFAVASSLVQTQGVERVIP